MAQDNLTKEVEKILKGLDMIYKDNNGYYFNIYADRYDFANFDDYLEELFEDNDFKSKDEVYTAINEYIYEMYEEYESDMYSEICESVYAGLDEEYFEEEYGNDFDYLREIVQDMVYVNYDDVFSKAYATTLKCFVALTDTNEEMNYDFGESDLYDFGKLDYSKFAELHNSNKFLCKSQGYKLKDLYEAFYNEKDIKSKFIWSLSEEYANASYGGCFVFLFELPLEEFMDIKFNTPKLMVSKNTLCGIYDWVGGSGGTLNVELEKDLTIPSGVYRVYCDGEIGYGVDEVFGLTRSAWSYGGLKYQKPKTKNKK